MSLVFTRMPGESYCGWLRSSLLCSCDVFQAVTSSALLWILQASLCFRLYRKCQTWRAVTELAQSECYGFAPCKEVHSFSVCTLQEMSDLSRYDREPAPEDLYGAACKGFHQAKCMLESLVTPTEEVRLFIIKNKKVIFYFLVYFFAPCGKFGSPQ